MFLKYENKTSLYYDKLLRNYKYLTDIQIDRNTTINRDKINGGKYDAMDENRMSRLTKATAQR
jgi:hypothetical protein